MINRPYVLFSRIPIVKNQSGRIFCDPLWAKDLKLHLDYLTNFHICCPVTYQNDVHRLDDITGVDIKNIFELKKDYGFTSVVKNFFPNFFQVIRACKKAYIVHSGGAGWAFPLSFYLLLLRPFFSFQWIIVIESSFWMLSANEKPTLRKAINHYLHKIILTWCVTSADARIFTQTYYRNFFLKSEDRTLIAPAIWVDKKQFLTPETVEQRFLGRKGKPLEIIFPARLEEDKGCFVLFDAIKALGKMGVCINITIMGSGVLEKTCKEFVSGSFGKVQVNYIDPVAYDSVFFNTLCNYDVVLVPNLKEEQPRIIFDAFSQGIGVIASDTSGILDITVDGENAIIFKRGDSQSLANAISYAVSNPDLVFQMGLRGLDFIENKSHAQMHEDRQFFLSRTINI
jgi:glycosyltransferase involved in cell wall biosynthesis